MSTELDDTNRAFAEAARAALRDSERTLDRTALVRLRAARALAVAQTEKPRRHLTWAIPVGAVSAGLLVFALLPQRVPMADTQGVEALEILADDMGPEFYQELDLYEWLDAQGEPA